MKKLIAITMILAVTTSYANAGFSSLADVITSTGSVPDGGALTVHVDNDTGALSIENTTAPAEPLSILGYSMFSVPGGPPGSPGNLDPGGWFGISDSMAADPMPTLMALGFSAGGMEKVSNNDGELSELNGTIVIAGAPATAPAVSQWAFGNPLVAGSNNNPGNFLFVYAKDTGGGLQAFYSDNVVFSGGGPGPGGHQGDPHMPNGPGAHGGSHGTDGRWRWEFNGVDVPVDGAWFDPPMADGYEYETNGASNFTSVGVPVGIAPGTFMVDDGINPPVPVAPGAPYVFPVAIDFFTITGIVPDVDGGDPLAFPTFLSFDQLNVTFTQTPIPEPATMGLMLFGAIGLIARKRRRG